MRSLWDSKIYDTREQTARVLYGRKLAMLGLVAAALLAGGTVFALPMRAGDPNTRPEAAISLKTSGTIHVPAVINTQVEPLKVADENKQAKVTVNGQDIPIPANGSTNQVVPSDDGDINVHTDSTTTGSSTNSSSSLLNIRVEGSGNVNAHSETSGGSSTINILQR